MEEEKQHDILEEGEIGTTVEEEEEEEEEEQEKSNPINGASTESFFDAHPWPVFRFDIPPRRAYHFAQQFRGGSNPQNFLKSVKWSPDGSAFLTSSDDQSLRLFYLPEDAYFNTGKLEECQISQDSYSSALTVNEAEMVYDYCWYPYMSMLDPTTCVFVSTTRDHPIHLWDTISGELRGTYRAYDAMDEITAALSVSFNTCGAKLFAGYDKHIRVFDVHRPGRDFEQYSLAKVDAGSLGIASSIAFSPTYSGMLAVGSYSQTTALYAETNMELLYVLHGQMGGVTQVQFSKDGNYLYTGGRKDPYILCWDIRNTVGVLYKLYRSSESTNQRISFDIEPSGRHLGTGGQDGIVQIYDLQSGEWVSGFQAASDTVNCFSFHPSVPLAATSSGNRRFILPGNVEDSYSLSGILTPNIFVIHACFYYIFILLFFLVYT
ncbi:Katanin p80 WD40 repeat-containing subunit B1 like [Dendrobium catenatum]|uniref:Katanin p80 WD40 repeat-containing subunit B1 like n=1 Tax=Dendrobium catenatum TaxID=906689 RepID=A0A2I0VY75_9ASPA|nr:Katanin p80 WD40 repeat-containing subunit B1 like [Dendrobium catenatum]